ncbi:MAG: helix-hairpin-helix domain-containing protein, partial [Candidatus Thermoplasmatota archaeon]
DSWIDVGMDTTYLFEGLEDGDHTVEVKAEGENGTSDHDTVNFTVETTILGVEIISPEEGDVLPPDVTVEWTSENADYHEIRLNGDGWIDVGMETSHTYEGLDGGEHFIEVKAVRGDASVIDTVNFTVDPDMVFLDINAPEDGDMLSEIDVTVQWDSYNIDYHEVKIEGGDWQYIGENTSHTFVDLDDGEFLVEVRGGWHDSDEYITDEVTFIVDTTPPELEITDPEEGEVFAEDSVMIQWQSSDDLSGINIHEIRLEGDWRITHSETAHTFEDLSNGQHTVELKAIDEAGNEVVKNVDIIVDTTPPDLEIISPEDGAIFDFDIVKVEWEGTPEITDITQYEVRLTDDWGPPESETAHTFEGLSDGVYEVSVRAIDEAGHETVDSINFTVDTTPPDLEITEPTSDEIFNRSDITVEWHCENYISEIDHYGFRLDEGNDDNWSEWTELQDTQFGLENLRDGEHMLEVIATDRAGHSSTETVEFLVDTIAPEISVVYPEEGEVLNDDAVTVEWDSSETLSGIDYYQIRIGDREWKEVSEFTEYDFTGLSDGSHEIEIRAIDNAGNVGQETVSFEVSTDDSTISQVMNTSCLLPLILAIIVALLFIVAWYGWRKEEEVEESKERPSSLEKREKPRKMMTKASTSPKGESAEPKTAVSSAETKMGSKKESEPAETIEEEEELGEVSKTPEEEPIESEDLLGPEEGVEEVGDIDTDKLDIVEKFQNIKGVGSGIAHALYDSGYHSKEELKEAEVGDLRDIEGIGFTQAELIHESIQKDEKKERTRRSPEVSEEDLKAYEVGPIVKGREMKKGTEEEKAPEVKDSDLETQQIDSKVFEEKPDEVEEGMVEEKELEECPICGASVSGGDEECPACGEPLKEEAEDAGLEECPVCGTGVPADAGECPVCGGSMVEEAEEEELEDEAIGEKRGVEEAMEEVPKEEVLDELSRLEGVGPSKAEKLYQTGIRSLKDLEGISKEELQGINGIGPALSEMILDSLEEIED